MALYGLPTSSHLIPEVKSCWAGLISRWETSWCPCAICLQGEVRLRLCSTLVPPTSGNVCGLSFSQSQPDLRIFLRLLWFSPLSKIDSKSKNIWLGCCAPGSYMAIKQQPLKCLSHAFGQSCGAASFTLQPLGCK